MKHCLVIGKYFFINMLHLSSVVAIFFIITIFNDLSVAAADSPKPRFITFNGCKCDALKCDCCAGIELATSPSHEVCININVVPNEITLKATVTVDGNTIYSGQLDPSVAPICPPPLAGVCLAINHVDLQKRQVCTKLSFLFFTLLKFPCIGQENGQLVVNPNTYP